MQKPSKKQRKTLERATALYEASLSQAIGYLTDRGITSIDVMTLARLGVVASPEPGHEHLIGRLVIPYIDMLGVYGMKFRCMVGHDCKSEGCSKYLALAGQEIGVYGVVDTDSIQDTIHVTEGELDRLILKQIFQDNPVVGIPGAQLWKPHHPFHLAGFERVLLWADGDKAGQDLANRIRHDVRAAETVNIPRGMDVTELFLEVGADVMREMAGMDDDEETE